MAARKRPGTISFLLAVLAAGVTLTGVYFALAPAIVPNPDLRATVIPTGVLARTNSDRAANGLPALRGNYLLDKAAQMKADDMAERGYFAHISPDGQSPLYWLDKVGYQYLNVGENLGRNYPDARALETGWMNSPEHRENVLRPEFTEAGVGTASGMYKGEMTTFAVEIFATPLPSAKGNSSGSGTEVVPIPDLISSKPLASTSDEDALYRATLGALILDLKRQIAELVARLALKPG
ncbi:MAG: CAP domain-containing protein [bacterium]